MDELGREIRYAMVMLGNAVVDIETGHYTAEERESLAKGLDQLAATLRNPETGERVMEGAHRSEGSTTR